MYWKYSWLWSHDNVYLCFMRVCRWHCIFSSLTFLFHPAFSSVWFDNHRNTGTLIHVYSAGSWHETVQCHDSSRTGHHSFCREYVFFWVSSMSINAHIVFPRNFRLGSKPVRCAVVSVRRSSSLSPVPLPTVPRGLRVYNGAGKGANRAISSVQEFGF